MKPTDIVRAIVERRGKSSRVAVHKIAYLTDYEFYLRRLFAGMILARYGYRIKARGESGLVYYKAKLGPFSTRLQNALERLVSRGEIDEVFEDGRFLYVPKNIRAYRLKEYFLEVLEKYVRLEDKELVSLALKRSRYSGIVSVPKL